MDLKHIFIENLVRYLHQIQALKQEIDFKNPELTSAKKQTYWSMMSACLCFEQIRAFESGLEKTVLKEIGIDFNALYDTLVQDRESFNFDRAIIWDFVGKIPELLKFIVKIV